MGEGEAEAMKYQVVNPVTGAVESEFPTATDAEIAAAIERSGCGLPAVERDDGRRARGRPASSGRPLRRARHRARRAHHPRDGQDHGRGRGRDRVRRRRSTATTPTTARRCSPTSRSRRQPAATAIVRKTAIGPLLGIMPWNYPYYQVARFAGPNLMVGNTILLKHAPQCPESALAMEQLFRDAGLHVGRVRQRLRHQRAGRRHHRRPAGRRCLGHRQRAGRHGRGVARRPAPEEGRPRARRLRCRSSCSTPPTCRAS